MPRFCAYFIPVIFVLFNFYYSQLAVMATEAIPSYEMLLKSNEQLTDKPKIVRLSENETATISCRISDAGYKSGSLSFLKNGKKISSTEGNVLTYNVQNYKSSGGPINFTCSATRLNGSKQTRLMRVTSRLSREITKKDVLCTVNKCVNDGVCVYGNEDKSLDSTEICVCPQSMRGDLCQYFDGNKRTLSNANPNYLYASIGLLFILAVVFAVLFGRENVFRKKRQATKRQLTQVHRESRGKQGLAGNNEPYPLDGYVICDGREDEGLTPNCVTVVNEYDNVPRVDERTPFKNKTIIKNPAKYADSIGVTEEIARSNRLFDSNPPLPVLANSQLPPPPSSVPR